MKNRTKDNNMFIRFEGDWVNEKTSKQLAIPEIDKLCKDLMVKLTEYFTKNPNTFVVLSMGKNGVNFNYNVSLLSEEHRDEFIQVALDQALELYAPIHWDWDAETGVWSQSYMQYDKEYKRPNLLDLRIHLMLYKDEEHFNTVYKRHFVVRNGL